MYRDEVHSYRCIPSAVFFSWAPFFLVSGCESWPNSILCFIICGQSMKSLVKCAAIILNKGAPKEYINVRRNNSEKKTYCATQISASRHILACIVIQVKPKCHRSWRKCVITHFFRDYIRSCAFAGKCGCGLNGYGMRRYELAAWHAPCDV